MVSSSVLLIIGILIKIKIAKAEKIQIERQNVIKKKNIKKRSKYTNSIYYFILYLNIDFKIQK